MNNAAILPQLMQVILERKTASAATSYTRRLLEGGVPQVAAKVQEEAQEVVEAAAELGDAGREHLVREAADLFYHLLVLLACRDLALADVEAELERRFGISGLEEKSSRGK